MLSIQTGSIYRNTTPIQPGMNNILVLGSTGNVGKPLVHTLRSAGETVLAASRTAGLDTIRFDYADRNTFAPALEGVDRVFLMTPPGHFAAHELLGPFLDEALKTPRKFVLLSADGVQYNDEAPLRQVELRLERSGHPFVLLRPNWFMDNFHTFWLPAIKATGSIPLPAGEESRTAFLNAADIAASAAASLLSNKFDNQAFSLTGPESLTYAEAAAVLSRHAGRIIEYRNIEESQLVESLIQGGLPEDYARFLAFLFSFVRQGAFSQVTDSVKTLTGRDPGTLEDYAATNAAAWR
jgi:uncharacterized protein YbjT (DUF2867 family)